MMEIPTPSIGINLSRRENGLLMRFTIDAGISSICTPAQMRFLKSSPLMMAMLVSFGDSQITVFSQAPDRAKFPSDSNYKLCERFYLKIEDDINQNL